MKHALALFALIVLMSLLSAASTIEVSVYSHNGSTPVLTGMELYSDPYPFERIPPNITGEYNIQIFWKGETKFDINADLATQMEVWDGPDGGGSRIVQLDTSRYLLPYFGSEERIRMSKNGQIIFDEWASKYLCNNNGICDSNEDYYGCPSDCPVQPATPPVTTLADKLGEVMIRNRSEIPDVGCHGCHDEVGSEDLVKEFLSNPLAFFSILSPICFPVLVACAAFILGRWSASRGNGGKKMTESHPEKYVGDREKSGQRKR
jgi:hypothetical protein